jgi:hypothetical protein
MGVPGWGDFRYLGRFLQADGCAIASVSGQLVALRQLAADGLVLVLVQLKGSAPVLAAIGNELERGDLELEPEEIKRLLRHQRLILLFDGVNEIPTEPSRQQLQEFRDAYPQTPMSFTTRDLAIGGSLGISKQLEMSRCHRSSCVSLWGNICRSRAIVYWHHCAVGYVCDRLLRAALDVFTQAIGTPTPDIQRQGRSRRQFDSFFPARSCLTS